MPVYLISQVNFVHTSIKLRLRHRLILGGEECFAPAREVCLNLVHSEVQRFCRYC